MNTGRPRDCDDETVLLAARAMIFCGCYPSARAVYVILGRRWSVRTCHSSLQRLRASGRLLERLEKFRESPARHVA